MLTVLAALMLAPAVYSLPEGSVRTMDVRVGFDGFLPVLGGREAKVDIEMEVGVRGLAPEEDRLRATNEIEKFRFLLDGAELPITVDTVTDYFPKTTVSLTPQGRVVKTDAPDRTLPIRLPALDVKRFPELTYLPIEFPEGELKEGKSWEFKRDFGGADVLYACRATEVTEETIALEVTMAQTYELLENEAREVVSAEADAVARVKTRLEASGKGIFDRKLGLFREFKASGLATSEVTELAGGATSQRRLKLTIETKLKLDK